MPLLFLGIDSYSEPTGKQDHHPHFSYDPSDPCPLAHMEPASMQNQGGFLLTHGGPHRHLSPVTLLREIGGNFCIIFMLKR